MLNLTDPMIRREILVCIMFFFCFSWKLTGQKNGSKIILPDIRLRKKNCSKHSSTSKKPQWLILKERQIISRYFYGPMLIFALALLDSPISGKM